MFNNLLTALEPPRRPIGLQRPGRVQERSRGIALVIAGTVIVALADYATGETTWLGPAYLMVIAFAAWTLGFGEAAVTGLVCLLGTTFMNDFNLYPFGEGTVWWNLALRYLSVITVMGFIDHARRSCEREWLLARTDPLTQTLNRKAFFELMATRRDASGWTLLAYADLDGLKALNDRSGHAEGDEALVAFADRVAKEVGPRGVFARVGGDEFIVQLDITDARDGKAEAERLHQTMNSVNLEGREKLRCSLGVLLMAPGPRSIDLEVRAADELMYEAKERGAGLSMATACKTGSKMALCTEGSSGCQSFPPPHAPGETLPKARRSSRAAA